MTITGFINRRRAFTVSSVAFEVRSVRPYCAAPPIRRMMIEMIPKPTFRQMDPLIVIPLLSQKI